jgi:hypothetical protein
MALGESANTGDSGEGNAARNLAATRTLNIAASEHARIVGRQALGVALCSFGIAFAGAAVGLRDQDPQSFDLSILLVIFGFAILITILGVLATIFRKENEQTQEDILNARAMIGRGVAKPSTFSKLAPPDGRVGTEYSYQVVADGLPGPTYGVVRGKLPAGLILDADGMLRGRPTAAAAYTFAVAATNSVGLLVGPDLTVRISAA